MKIIHDIRQQIPQFAANHFAPYKYEPYPRMMVNRDTGKPYLDSVKKPVSVNSTEAEIEFWASKGFKATIVTHPRTDIVETTLEAIDGTGPAPVAAKVIDIPVAVQPVIQPMAVAATEEAPKRRGRPPLVKLPQDLK